MEGNVDWLRRGAKEAELHRGATGGGDCVAVPFAGHISDDGWTSWGATSFRDCPSFLIR